MNTMHTHVLGLAACQGSARAQASRAPRCPSGCSRSAHQHAHAHVSAAQFKPCRWHRDVHGRARRFAACSAAQLQSVRGVHM